MHERERTRPVGAFDAAHAKQAASHHRQFTQAERRRIFRQMVVHELEAGVLRYSRRRALLRYAEEIGIAPFDANLLIAEAQYGAKQLDPAEFDARADFPLPPFEPADRPEAFSSGYQLLFALLIAAMIDLMLIVWING
ncbi:MAG: hypothetical protein ACPMAQ_02695 [Phycisphaerae bacterium]